MRIHLCSVRSQRSHRGALLALAARLRSAGFAVTSRWLEAEGRVAVDWDPERRARRAFSDVSGAHVCVLLLAAEQGAPGAEGEFELGLGVGMNKLCVVVGDDPRPHHWLPGILRVQSVDELEHLLVATSTHAEKAALLCAERSLGWFLE